MYLIIDESGYPNFAKSLEKDILAGHKCGILNIFRFESVFQEWLGDKGWVDVEEWSS